MKAKVKIPKEQKKEIRNETFGGSMRPSEYRILERLAKTEKRSKTEIIVRAIMEYRDKYYEI